MLLVRSLPEQAQFLEPFSDTCGMPTIAIPADDELVARPGAFGASPPAAEGFGCRANCIAIVLRSGGVPQRLVDDVAAIAHEVPQKHQPVIRPILRPGWLGDPARKRHPVTDFQRAHGFPARPGKNAVLMRGTQGAATGELHLVNRPLAHLPDLVRPRSYQSLIL